MVCFWLSAGMSPYRSNLLKLFYFSVVSLILLNMCIWARSKNFNVISIQILFRITELYLNKGYSWIIVTIQTVAFNYNISHNAIEQYNLRILNIHNVRSRRQSSQATETGDIYLHIAQSLEMKTMTAYICRIKKRHAHLARWWIRTIRCQSSFSCVIPIAELSLWLKSL